VPEWPEQLDLLERESEDERGSLAVTCPDCVAPVATLLFEDDDRRTPAVITRGRPATHLRNPHLCQSP
jgi:hypothetical protein